MRQREFLSPGENAMAKANLARMNVESLLDLRDQVDQRLRQHRGELQEQLEKIASLTGERAVRGRRRGASTLRGRKVAPKYRSLSGETWAGRGARPRWLVAAIKEGKKLDDFLIDKSARKIRKKRRSKR
jgi:DNA-binding protein H-NS